MARCHRRQSTRLSGNAYISRQSDRKLALPTLAYGAVDDLCYDVPEFPQLACWAVLDCCRVRRNLRAGELLRGAGAGALTGGVADGAPASWRFDGVSLSRHVAAFQIQGESSSADEEESLGALPGMSF